MGTLQNIGALSAVAIGVSVWLQTSVAYGALTNETADASSMPAPTPTPIEAGWSAELGLGVTDSLITEYGGKEPSLHIAPLIFGLSYRWNAQWAAYGRVANMLLNSGPDYGKSTYLVSTWTVGLRRNLTDRWFVGGGMGVALFLLAPILDRPTDVDRTMAASAHGGWMFHRFGAGGLNIELEASLAPFKDGVWMFSWGLLATWQTN
ncbi:MAG: hypothetical protein H6729_08235 [Deltaproteobacteria bacterium]|nr:hypothetical protein [Deltaproteobacteria bacterium]